MKKTCTRRLVLCCMAAGLILGSCGLEENPGGILDISSANYEQNDEQTVKVSGSRWIPAPYTLKVEGASQVGYRTICICGIRDERVGVLEYLWWV